MAFRFENHRGRERVPSASRRRVLVVDEDSNDLQYYAAILQQQGYEVRTCNTYLEGDECLRCGPYDIIIVSQGSHAFEGRSLLERVLAIDRRTPVLVLTRCVDMDCYLEAMQMGAVDYLEKPLTPAELAHVIETHLRPVGLAA